MNCYVLVLLIIDIMCELTIIWFTILSDSTLLNNDQTCQVCTPVYKINKWLNVKITVIRHMIHSTSLDFECAFQLCTHVHKIVKVTACQNDCNCT